MTLKAAILLCLFATIVTVNCGHQSPTTTELPTTTTTTQRQSLFINNNVPKLDDGCKGIYKCATKLKSATAPKPCIKYCLRFVECNGIKVKRSGTECVELNEALVEQEYLESKKQTNNVPIMQVALIDFPCQPNYLPDSRGRCREIW